jgi:hypothetical protein
VLEEFDEGFGDLYTRVIVIGLKAGKRDDGLDTHGRLTITRPFPQTIS